MFSTQYIDTVLDSLSSVTAQLESVTKIGDFIAGTVKDGKKVYVMDRYGIIDAELVDRPSCLVLFRSFRSEGIGMTTGDILLLSSFSSDDNNDLDIVAQAHARGSIVITISPEGALSHTADRALINNGCGENGAISIPGIEKRFCPINGIVNAALAWALVAEVTASLLKLQVVPSVFRGEYLAGSDGKNIEARKRYISYGY